MPILAGVGYIGFALQDFIAAEADNMAEMRTFVDESYPEYKIVDSTRSGYVLRHREKTSLRLDVRFERNGQRDVWGGPPRETLSGGWATSETFFRHAEGMPADPRTKMNYDVDGFFDAYRPLRPGRNAVVSAVWLDGKDVYGMESYIVLVARRDRHGTHVEDMWPDHRARFTRDSKTGKWTGTAFEPVKIANPN